MAPERTTEMSIIQHSHGEIPTQEAAIAVANLAGIERPADIRRYIVLADTGTRELTIGTHMCASCIVKLLRAALDVMIRGIADEAEEDL